MVADSTLQLTFKKLSLLDEFGYGTKKYHSYLKKLIKKLLLSPTAYLCKAIFSPFTSANVYSAKVYQSRMGAEK